MNIKDFAEARGLDLEYRTYTVDHHVVHFKGVDVIEPGALCSASGSGVTPEQALADYAKRISEQYLRYSRNYNHEERFKAPILTYKTTTLKAELLDRLLEVMDDAGVLPEERAETMRIAAATQDKSRRKS